MPKVTPSSVMSMEAVCKLDQKAAVGLFAEKDQAQSRLFVECAKLMIHLETTLRPTQTLYGLLKGRGIREATINNARQAQRVWDVAVKGKAMTEAQFDKLTFADCVAFNYVAKVRGHEFAVGIALDMDEVHHIKETGQTKAELDAAVTPPAQTPPAAAPAKAAKGKAPAATPAPAAPEAKPENVVPMKHTLAEADTLISNLETIALDLAPGDLVELSKRLVHLVEGVQALTVEAKKSA